MFVASVILHIGTTTMQPPAGMEHLIANLAHFQSVQGHNVRVLFPKFTTSAASAGLSALFFKLGVPLEFGPASLRYDRRRDAFHIKELSHIVRQTPPNTVIHLHYSESFLSFYDVLSVRLGGRRCIVSFHGISNWREAGLRKRVVTCAISRICSVLTANSSATARAVLAAGVPGRLLRTIPCGVPEPGEPRQQSADARRRLGITDNAFVITTASRLILRKRVASVIEAASRLPKIDDAPFVVLVAGDGPERNSLEALAQELGVPARFLGYQPDMSDVYSASDVFALTAEEEAFGLVYVEAAFYGVPSIALDSGGVADIILNGETGILLPSGDIEGIASALALLRDNTEYRRTLGEAARERARRLFSLSAVTDQFDKAYGHLYRPAVENPSRNPPAAE